MMETHNIRLKIHLAVFTALLSVGIIGFMVTEKFSLTDAIYFSIVTMATVGYGDIHPQSVIGKILALVIIVGGVGAFLSVVASITDLFVNRREESLRYQKLNMVTGLFFSEMGSGLLKRFTQLDSRTETLHKILKIQDEWKDEDFDEAYGRLKQHRFLIDSGRGDISELREYLQDKADLLRAIFHLRDELLNRSDLSELPSYDRQHIEGDIVRIYSLLAFEWVRYMRYLKKNYGYLFSLAMRLNPFDPEANAVISNSCKL